MEEVKAMAKDIVDRKARTGIPDAPGLGKVVNETAWGENKALERTKDYGGLKQTDMRPADRSYPQDPEAKRGPDWADDHPNDWVRGGGPNAAEGRPGYVPGYKGKK